MEASRVTRRCPRGASAHDSGARTDVDGARTERRHARDDRAWARGNSRRRGRMPAGRTRRSKRCIGSSMGCTRNSNTRMRCSLRWSLATAHRAPATLRRRSESWRMGLSRSSRVVSHSRTLGRYRLAMIRWSLDCLGRGNRMRLGVPLWAGSGVAVLAGWWVMHNSVRCHGGGERRIVQWRWGS
jgi:hypothetical protein